MTPQATRPPAFPVFKLSALPPLPRIKALLNPYPTNAPYGKLTQIVLFLMHHHRASDNRVLSVQADHSIGHVEFRYAARIRFHIAQIANMTVVILVSKVICTPISLCKLTRTYLRTTVSVLERIEMRTSRFASFRIISEFVHVKTVFSGRQTFDFAVNPGRTRLLQKIKPTSKF